MKIQFDNNESLEVTRSPYHSEERLVMYISLGQVSVEGLVSQAKAAQHVYFYVNNVVMATYTGYSTFDSVVYNDTEVTLTMINPNPEKSKGDEYSEYVEAVKILLGDDTVGEDVNTDMEVQ